MNYILKPDGICFSTANQPNTQYINWLEKQRVQKEREQLQTLRKSWFELDAEETEQMISSKKAEQHNNVDMYAKNVKWRQAVESKIENLREKQEMEQIKREKQQREMRREGPKVVLKELSEHEGPIKGWKHRFDDYLKSKIELDAVGNVGFRPRINQNSKRMTSQITGKVEDRLIDYGQRLKIKKAEMEIEYQKQIGRQIVPNQSINSHLSDVFWRLHKEGERINKEKAKQASIYTFTPQTNPLTPQMKSRVDSRRKPLHQKKQKLLNQHNPIKNKVKEGGFDTFLLRNTLLLEKIRQNRIKKEVDIRERAMMEIRECTFTPEINENSCRLFEQRQLQLIRESQFEDEKSGQIKKMADTRLFPDSSENTGGNTDRLPQEQKSSRLSLIEPRDLRVSQSWISTRNGIMESHIKEENEEDSLQKMKDMDWKVELEGVETRISEMLRRVANQ